MRWGRDVTGVNVEERMDLVAIAKLALNTPG